MRQRGFSFYQLLNEATRNPIKFCDAVIKE